MNSEPLASQIRPDTLSAFVGQSHLVGKDKPLRVAMKKGLLFSIIFWGPPGVGKTTLARIYAHSLKADFVDLSAVSACKADIRKVVEQANASSQPTILFLDEIHRFNKAQQDFLLPFVETGILTLIGATTENPSFEVISPLLSRCRVFILKELSEEEISLIIDRAISKIGKIKLSATARNWLISFANSDARQAISIIESTYGLYRKLTVASLKDALQSQHLRFDKKGEEHYNTISAFIKSMRASNADAAVYYLARMVEAGEDPLFIARRMVIFASEDIGLAQPTALVVANEVFSACQMIGYPECAINLAHGVAYLANAKKDRSAYNALRSAQKDIRSYGNLPIPLKLRNATTGFNEFLGYGQGYQKYGDKDLMPDKLKGKKYFKK